MEAYLVKEEVKIVKVSEAVWQKKKVNIVERTILTVPDLPVTISSICSDVGDHDHSEKFAKRVERKLIKKHYDDDKFASLTLDLIISNNSDAPSPAGFIMLSTKSKDFNVFQRLYEEFGYGKARCNVQISMCHLPTENASVHPECLISLEVANQLIFCCSNPGRLGTGYPVHVSREMMKWWEERGTTTGFIYCKTSVTINLKAKAVNQVYGCSNMNKSLLQDADFKDVEIQCKNRSEIVKCHRALLADKSAVLRGKFKEMLEQRGEQAGPWKLEMKQMSKKGVESFLEFIYCGRVSRGLTSCDAALELLMAAREYQVVGLGNAMEEIIMGKGTSDLNYFTVKSALHLFLYARDPGLVDLEYLRDKAVWVLQNFLKTKHEKILNSKEYQDLFVKQPHIAMELTSLYMMLS